jgi:hypothetical protein
MLMRISTNGDDAITGIEGFFGRRMDKKYLGKKQALSFLSRSKTQGLYVIGRRRERCLSASCEGKGEKKAKRRRASYG